MVWLFNPNFGFFSLFSLLKTILVAQSQGAERGRQATSHSTIFYIRMRPLREGQKYRDRFTR